MTSLLSRLRRRGDVASVPVDDDRLLIALVNEARSDAQRERAIRSARAHTAAARRARA